MSSVPKERVTINLDEVGEAMDLQGVMGDSTEPLLDRLTGHVVYDPIECMGSPEHYEVELHWHIVNYPDRFERIPKIDGHEEYRWMEDFVRDIEEDDIHSRLQDALDGQGAFKRFKRVLFDYPDVRERWLSIRAEHLASEATAWLATTDIPYVADRRRPPSPQAPKTTNPGLPLGLVHVLTLGAHPDHPPVREETVRRVIPAAKRDPRELFKILVRDLCAMSGLSWRNRFIQGRNDFSLAGIHITQGKDMVYVDVEVPREVCDLFPRPGRRAR
jgi:hypothetical protein